MKYFFPVLTVFFLLSTIYYYHEHRETKQNLVEAVTSHQAELMELSEECETRVAQLRYECEQRVAQLQASPGPGNLFAFIQQAQERKRMAREDILRGAQSNLELSDHAYEQFLLIFEEFEKEKKSILELSITEKRPVFESRYMDMLEDRKTKAMAELEHILSEAQFHRFLEQEMDIGLGLHGFPVIRE